MGRNDGNSSGIIKKKPYANENEGNPITGVGYNEMRKYSRKRIDVDN
jgi:hypothetical protein